MTVQAIMTRDITTLQPSDRVQHGLRLMHEKRVRGLPVVSGDGEFVGLFGIRQVVHLLLPAAARIDHGLTNLSFMPDDTGGLYNRLRRVGDQPVSDFLEPSGELLICDPATSIPELLELLHQSFNTSLPVLVVDGGSNRLVGMVSGWDVLEKLVMAVYGEEGGSAG